MPMSPHEVHTALSDPAANYATAIARVRQWYALLSTLHPSLAKALAMVLHKWTITSMTDAVRPLQEDQHHAAWGAAFSLLGS